VSGARVAQTLLRLTVSKMSHVVGPEAPFTSLLVFKENKAG